MGLIMKGTIPRVPPFSLWFIPKIYPNTVRTSDCDSEKHTGVRTKPVPALFFLKTNLEFLLRFTHNNIHSFIFFHNSKTHNWWNVKRFRFRRNRKTYTLTRPLGAWLWYRLGKWKLASTKWGVDKPWQNWEETCRSRTCWKQHVCAEKKRI